MCTLKQLYTSKQTLCREKIIRSQVAGPGLSCFNSVKKEVGKQSSHSMVF